MTAGGRQRRLRRAFPWSAAIGIAGTACPLPTTDCSLRARGPRCAGSWERPSGFLCSASRSTRAHCPRRFDPRPPRRLRVPEGGGSDRILGANQAVKLDAPQADDSPGGGPDAEARGAFRRLDHRDRRFPRPAKSSTAVIGFPAFASPWPRSSRMSPNRAEPGGIRSWFL